MERTKYTPKRLLSLLLALIMLLGMFPTAVFAAQPTNGNMRVSKFEEAGITFEANIKCDKPLNVNSLGEVTVTVDGRSQRLIRMFRRLRLAPVEI